MDISKLLPIGSIIRVKDANKKMMITGILQKSDNVVYDYIGVLYPEGYMSEEKLFLFNNTDIADVFYVGYMDLEHQAFRSSVQKLLEEHGYPN